MDQREDAITRLTSKGAAMHRLETQLDAKERDLEQRKLYIETQRIHNAITYKLLENQKLEASRRERMLVRRSAELKRRGAINRKEFTLFPSLPIELRLRIWSFVETSYHEPSIHSIRGFAHGLLDSKLTTRTPVDEQDLLAEKIELPRMREVVRYHDYYRMVTWPDSKPNWSFDRVVFLSPHSIDPILHTCHESRNFALKTFNLTFAFETYINFDKETIYLDRSPGIKYWEMEVLVSCLVTELLDQDFRKKVKSLALCGTCDEDADVERWLSDEDVFRVISGMLRDEISGLEELIVVHYDNRGLKERMAMPVERTWLSRTILPMNQKTSNTTNISRKDPIEVPNRNSRHTGMSWLSVLEI